MSRFIVRTHPLSDDYFRWQRGVVLGWGNARALVMEERRRNPRVDVFILGGTAERQELAGVVRANMEEIHRGLPDGLKGQEELDLSVPGEQYESVEKLEQLEAQNMPVQVMTRSWRAESAGDAGAGAGAACQSAAEGCAEAQNLRELCARELQSVGEAEAASGCAQE
jgi:hypothetical protein